MKSLWVERGNFGVSPYYRPLLQISEPIPHKNHHATMEANVNTLLPKGGMNWNLLYCRAERFTIGQGIKFNKRVNIAHAPMNPIFALRDVKTLLQRVVIMYSATSCCCPFHISYSLTKTQNN